MVTSVSFTKMPIRLVKVIHKDGYQLVAGGRLVLSVDGGVTHPHAELPEYGLSDFPVDFTRWGDGEEGDDVQVVVVGRSGKLRHISSVRAFVMLFVAADADAVRSWIRRNACSD